MNPATAYEHIFSPQGRDPEDFRAPGIVTFMRSDNVDLSAEALRATGARYAFLGVPYEEGNVGKPGSVEGPRGMRFASHDYFPYWFEYRVDLHGQIVDCGNVRVPQVDPEMAHARIYRAVREILSAGLVPIICGGDHSITIPAARALSDHLGDERMGYMQLGAQLAMADSWAGETQTNMSVLARVSELPNARAENIAQFGARNSLNPKDWIDLCRTRDVRFFAIDEILERGVRDTLTEAVARISEGTAKQFLSIDMNVMDAACAPGVTLPEPGGLEAREMVTAAEILGRLPDVGAIVVAELSPHFDVNSMTTKLAASTVLRLLASRADAQGEHVAQSVTLQR